MRMMISVYVSPCKRIYMDRKIDDDLVGGGLGHLLGGDGGSILGAELLYSLVVTLVPLVHHIRAKN